MAIEKYRIIGENIYNFDKKGFRIKVGITSAWLMTHAELASGEIIRVSQDGSREWVLLLAAICAVLVIILLALIYQRESSNLRSTWIDDIGQDIVYFVAIPTG